MKFGLENISKLCAALSHPERSFGSVLIAGTNGKGSVTAMVHHGLIEAGVRAARYTSPHLERLEERYVVGRNEIDTPRLAAAVARVRDAAAALQRSGALETPPTFFECATAAAFELFREAGVEIAVLEVGLGGRLDATNVAHPFVTAVTSIGFDHQAQLGDTLESIAFEKAGIIRPGVPVICGDLPAEADGVIAGICRERNAPLIRVVGVRGSRTVDRLDPPRAGRPASTRQCGGGRLCAAERRRGRCEGGGCGDSRRADRGRPGRPASNAFAIVPRMCCSMRRTTPTAPERSPLTLTKRDGPAVRSCSGRCGTRRWLRCWRPCRRRAPRSSARRRALPAP